MKKKTKKIYVMGKRKKQRQRHYEQKEIYEKTKERKKLG